MAGGSTVLPPLRESCGEITALAVWPYMTHTAPGQPIKVHMLAFENARCFHDLSFALLARYFRDLLFLHDGWCCQVLLLRSALRLVVQSCPLSLPFPRFRALHLSRFCVSSALSRSISLFLSSSSCPPLALQRARLLAIAERGANGKALVSIWDITGGNFRKRGRGPLSTMEVGCDDGFRACADFLDFEECGIARQ